MEGEFKVVAKTSSDPVYWLDRLASIYRHLSVHVNKGETHPCQAVITYTWPSLSAVMDKFQTDKRVMERCCRCLRFALRLIGHQSAPLLQPLVTQVHCCTNYDILGHGLIFLLLLDGAIVQCTPPQLFPLSG